ncbi:hypothetical protein [Hominenteromicrobium sp.]|uniref:hypothetical protein n=1 Tax=Hominenteromicrobium sp. TaxID=3073581 RepID=UPI003999B373
MAQKATPGNFVIRCHFEIAQQAADIDDDAVGYFVFRHAAVHGDDVVRAALVNAGDDASGTRGAECGLHLVAVVVGVPHADDGLYAAEFAEQADARALLMRELFVVIEVLQLAAAALFAVRTARFVCVFSIFMRSFRS